MMQYKKVESPSGCCLSEVKEDGEGKFPQSYIKVPEGMTGLTLGKEVTLTIKGKIVGFSAHSWQDCQEVELELHAADMKASSEGDEFAAMAEDD